MHVFKYALHRPLAIIGINNSDTMKIHDLIELLSYS